MYFFHYRAKTQSCQYKSTVPFQDKIKSTFMLFPFLLVGLLAGVILISQGWDKVEFFNSLTLIGLLLTFTAVLVLNFGLISVLRSFKRYQYEKSFFPVFDGVSKNLAVFVIVTVLYGLGFVYLWLPNLPVIKPNNRLYLVPLFLIALPGTGVLVATGAWLNAVFNRITIKVDQSTKTLSLKVWSRFDTYRSFKFNLNDPIWIIKKNFLYKSRHDSEFPGSKAYAAIIENQGNRHLVYWNSEELCTAFISELRQCTDWQVTEEEAGFIDKNSYKCVV